MEAIIATTLIVGNLIALVIHLADPDGRSEEVFALSLSGLFFAIGSILALTFFGVENTVLGILIWMSAAISAFFFLIGPLNSPSGQG
jgi:hypothetical protein